jgi:hypothetical protein
MDGADTDGVVIIMVAGVITDTVGGIPVGAGVTLAGAGVDAGEVWVLGLHLVQHWGPHIMITLPKSSYQHPSHQNAGPVRPPPSIHSHAVVKKTFLAQHPNELTVAALDRVEVFGDVQNGWSYVADAFGHRGYVPTAYLEPELPEQLKQNEQQIEATIGARHSHKRRI